ncbi:MAG: class I SAM-dependent methyltransferase, partial [Acetobacteraceae bacterium]
VPTLNTEHFRNCRLFQDRRALLEIVPKHSVGAELGVYRGDFLRILLADLLPKHLALVDVNFAVDVSRVFAGPIASGVVSVIESDSSAALEKFPDEHFDWIYIDGDHSPEGARKDAFVAKRKIKKDGILIFNDYKMGDHNYPAGFYAYGVINAANDLCIHDGFELIAFAFHPQMYCDVALRRRSWGAS